MKEVSLHPAPHCAPDNESLRPVIWADLVTRASAARAARMAVSARDGDGVASFAGLAEQSSAGVNQAGLAYRKGLPPMMFDVGDADARGAS